MGRYHAGNENFRLAFEVWGKQKEDLPIGYQEIKFHSIFDIKLVEKFRRKVGIVGGRHTTNALVSIA